LTGAGIGVDEGADDTESFDTVEASEGARGRFVEGLVEEEEEEGAGGGEVGE
jgi:hypothetical protein